MAGARGPEEPRPPTFEEGGFSARPLPHSVRPKAVSVDSPRGWLVMAGAFLANVVAFGTTSGVSSAPRGRGRHRFHPGIRRRHRAVGGGGLRLVGAAAWPRVAHVDHVEMHDVRAVERAVCLPWERGAGGPMTAFMSPARYAPSRPGPVGPPRCPETGDDEKGSIGRASSAWDASSYRAPFAAYPPPPWSKRDRRASRLECTSMRTGWPSLFRAWALASAGAISAGCLTTMPTAPRPSAILA